jgi:hypothetical protein
LILFKKEIEKNENKKSLGSPLNKMKKNSFPSTFIYCRLGVYVIIFPFLGHCLGGYLRPINI